MPRAGKEVAAPSTAVTLQIFNPLTTPLSLVWVPDAAAEIEYAQIAPGDDMTQQTNIGHRWLLRTADGETVAELVTTSAPTQQLVAGENAPAAAGSSSASASAPAVAEPAPVPAGLIMLEVKNFTDAPLALVWIPDGGGEPKEYAQLAPGDTMEQQSSVGHCWRLRGAGGEAAAEAVTTSAARQQLIAENAAPPAATDAPPAAEERTLVSLEVRNATLAPLSLVWVPDGGAEPREYAQVAPGDEMAQPSNIGHRWRLRSADGASVAEVVTTSAPTQPLLASASSPATEDAAAAEKAAAEKAAAERAAAEEEALAAQVRAFYAQEVDAGVAGIRIRASARVSSTALDAAARIVRRMLRDAPAALLARLEACGCTVAVIGKDELASDIPEHRATCADAAALAAVADRTRGLGGTARVPVTSCGEENVLMGVAGEGADPHYPLESILVHAHAQAQAQAHARARARAHPLMCMWRVRRCTSSATRVEAGVVTQMRQVPTSRGAESPSSIICARRAVSLGVGV